MRRVVWAFSLAANATALSAADLPARIGRGDYATSGKWNVQFNETTCLAIQEFAALDPASPDPKLALMLKYSPSGNVVALFLYRPAKRSVEADQREVALQLDGRPELPLSSLRYTFLDKHEKNTIDQIIVGPAVIEQLRHSSLLKMKLGGPDLVLPLKSMDRVMATLDQCRATLSAYWNVDDAIRRRSSLDARAKHKPELLRPATPGTPPVAITPASSLFSSNDYPAAALRSGQSGLTSAELLIDELGAVKECFVNETSGIATLDVMTCLRLMHARYQPARDAGGKAVRSYDDVQIKWVAGR